MYFELLSFDLKNVTVGDDDDEGGGSVEIRNVSMFEAHTTEMRDNDAYIRDYILIANTVCVLILPTAIMLVSTFFIVRQMLMAPSSALTFSTEQERARKKRNR